MSNKIKNIFEDKSGQMLLFVLIILLLLFIIVIAIVVNVRTDMKEVQVEREYEKAYSIAEGELVKITANSFETWVEGDGVSNIIPDGLTSFCPSDGCSSGDWECNYKCGLGESGNSCVLVKTCSQNSVEDRAIYKDQTFEVNLEDSSGNIEFGWANPFVGNPKSVMVILVYKVGTEYKSTRFCKCYSGKCLVDGCESTSEIGFSLNIGTYIEGGDAQFIRFRAIGDDITGFWAIGDLPVQELEVRSQGFTESVEDAGDQLFIELPAPELYTRIPVRKQLPALFDYVLFVADGGVSK